MKRLLACLVCVVSLAAVTLTPSTASAGVHVSIGWGWGGWGWGDDIIRVIATTDTIRVIATTDTTDTGGVIIVDTGVIIMATTGITLIIADGLAGQRARGNIAPRSDRCQCATGEAQRHDAPTNGSDKYRQAANPFETAQMERRPGRDRFCYARAD